MNTNRLFLLLCLAFVVSTSFADNWLLLKMKSGSSQGFQIPGSMKIQVVDSSNELQLSSEQTTVSFALEKVAGYSFIDDRNIESSIDDVLSDGIRITYLDKDRVVIEGLAGDAVVRLYGVNGVEHTVTSSVSGIATTISLSNLPKGVYIINIANLASVKVNH